MGWKGIAIGGYLGSVLGGTLGALVGAAIGHKVENLAFGARRPRENPASASAAHDPLAEAYAVLGASADDSADELRRKYRELAKRNHPDSLRVQGQSAEAVARATERMGRINDAWAMVRKERGI